MAAAALGSDACNAMDQERGSEVRALAAQLNVLSKQLLAAYDAEVARLRSQVEEAPIAAAAATPEQPVMLTLDEDAAPEPPPDEHHWGPDRLVKLPADHSHRGDLGPPPEDELAGESCGKRLRIEIVSAINLRDADWMIGTGMSDPYCICKIVGKEGVQPITTHTINDSLTPVWHYVGVLPNFCEGDMLEFSVWDEDVGKQDDFLGSAELTSASLLPDGFEGSLQLVEQSAETMKAKPSKAKAPELRVKVVVEEDDHEHLAKLRRRSEAIWSAVPHDDITEKVFESEVHGGTPARRAKEWVDFYEAKCLSWLQRRVVPPSSERRMTWDIIALITVLYDAYTIPFMTAFEVDMTLPLLILSMTVASFWTLDLVCNFFTGVHVNGFVEMRLSLITSRYLKTWFLPDLAIVGLDWTFIMLWLSEYADDPNGSKLLRVAKSTRALRSIRLLSLARIGRASGIMQDLLAHLQHEVTSVLIILVESLGIILLATHLVGCTWYAIGEPAGEERTWISVRDLSDEDVVYRYATSFHWALTQFTPASMEVQPTNTRERIFTVAIDLCGLLAFSTFVSTITTRMTQLRSFNKTKQTQIRNLRNYIYQHGISLELSFRIMHFVRSNKALLRPRTSTRGIELLRDLPDSLRKELDCEVFLPVFSSHPMFQRMIALDRDLASDICTSCVWEEALLAKDVLFLKGDAAKHMYFVHSGQVIYRQGGAEMNLYVGDWLAEASLWLDGWVHLGDCIAAKRCDVVGLKQQELRAVLNKHMLHSGLGVRLVFRYALTFVRDEGTETQDLVFRCSDFWGDADYIHGLLAMAASSRSTYQVPHAQGGNLFQNIMSKLSLS